MGGVIDVESTVGSGSTFWIELPRTEGPLEQHARLVDAGALPSLAAPSSTLRHTVLYVEDNLANIKLIEHVVRHRPDVELVWALQGRLGIELAQQHPLALILLDLHLPDMNGDEVLAELRANPSTATTPVFVLSADATEHQRARLLAAGASAYVTKPIDVRDFLQLVDDVLGPPVPDAATPVPAEGAAAVGRSR